MIDDLGDGLGSADGPEAIGEHARAALDEAGTWLGEGVVAVGLGRTEAGLACVVAHVRDPAPELPAEVGGVPVRVVDSGPIEALGVPQADDPD